MRRGFLSMWNNYEELYLKMVKIIELFLIVDLRDILVYQLMK